jgi:hypothetical protein
MLIVAMLVGIGVCLWRITAAAPTPNEALLLSLFLTLLSILGSWIVSRYYSESSFNKSLRIFALKAAEKVTNLSNELDRLSAFVQQELKDNEYESPAEALLAKSIRFEGVIHIINTLKSVNDRSLSDWQGSLARRYQPREKFKRKERRQYANYWNASIRSSTRHWNRYLHTMTKSVIIYFRRSHPFAPSCDCLPPKLVVCLLFPPARQKGWTFRKPAQTVVPCFNTVRSPKLRM